MIKDIIELLQELKSNGWRAIAVAVPLLCLGFFMYALMTGVGAEWVDDRLQISKKVGDRVVKEIGDRLIKEVDSGYSYTFVFSPQNPESSQELLFYAVPDQPVKIMFVTETNDPQSVHIEIQRDGAHYADGNGNLHTEDPPAEPMKADILRGNLHSIRVTCKAPRAHAPVVVKVLVLVSNPPPVQQK